MTKPLQKKQRHKLLIEWLTIDYYNTINIMSELDLIEYWTDDQVELYEELEYRKKWLLKQIKLLKI